MIPPILSEDDIARVHASSLRVLEQTGFSVEDRDLCRELSARGIPADESSGRVKMPSEVVENALRTAPGGFTIHARDGTSLEVLPGKWPPSTYGGSTKVLDYGADALRPSTYVDLVRFVRLGDALPDVHIVKEVCCAQDIPEDGRCPRSVAAVMSHSGKFAAAAPLNLEEARVWTDLAERTADDGDLAEHPNICIGIVATSPLRLNRDSAEILRHTTAVGIPLQITTSPIVGVSSPVTLAGTLAVINAEHLFLLTVAQILREGSPVCLGGSLGLMDMQSGDVSFGCQERYLVLAANIQLLSHYGLPYYTAAGPVDSWHPDVQCGAEKALIWGARGPESGLPAATFGALMGGQAVSLEQMVIDAEIYRAVERLHRPFGVDEEALAIEAIDRVGPGGSFLTDPHTLRRLRQEERAVSDLMNRAGHQGTDMLEKAHDRVEEILSDHRPDVPDRILDEVERYLREKGCLEAA
jgi:trimethylamine--corrinoid protein Co-methyltransferase